MPFTPTSRLVAGLLLVLAAVASAQTSDPPLPITSRHFFYPDFGSASENATGSVAKVGSAARALEDLDPVLRLTSAANQAGAAWYRIKQKVGDGFEATFDYRVTGTGDSGLAFVLHNAPTTVGAIGGGGCNLGYSGIAPSLAIELDAAQSSPGCLAEDNSGAHLSVQTGGNPSRTNSIRSANVPHLADGRLHTITIQYQPGTLKVFFDDGLALTASVDLQATLGSDTAWVGFTAGTGAAAVTQDVLSWFFVEQAGVTCLEYDFTPSSHAAQGWRPSPYSGGAGWPLNGNGWERALGGEQVDGRWTEGVGISKGTEDLEQILRDGEGFDPALLASIRNGQAPIQQIVATYTADPSGGPITAGFDLEVPSGLLTGRRSGIALSQEPSEVVDGETRYTSGIRVRPADVPNAVNPTGLTLRLTGANVLRLKKVGLCVAVPVRRPMVLPPGAGRACANLLDNIKTRSQPYGSNTSQPEFTGGADVTLEPYPAFSLNAQGYPQMLSYDRLWLQSRPGHAAIPCVFTEPAGATGRRFYNPGAPGQPLVRFTATGTDNAIREALIVLSYAAYYSVGSPNWCYAGDNAFMKMDDRGTPSLWGPGYNVPSPKYDCNNPDDLIWGSDGPCGSFAGSLLRALGYFNVTAFAAANSQNRDWAFGLQNLYYGVEEYELYALPSNRYFTATPATPFVRPRWDNPRAYNPYQVQHRGIRVYPVAPGGGHFYGLSGDRSALSPVRCLDEDSYCAKPEYGCDRQWCFSHEAECIAKLCAEHPETCDPINRCNRTRNAVGSHWREPNLEIVPSPKNPASRPISDARALWKRIKPGDIAITAVEGADLINDDGTLMSGGTPMDPAKAAYTHIQIVVGWGKRSLEYSVGDARNGLFLYPRYTDIPLTESERETLYVPYVFDRSTLPGTGSSGGPRPFSDELWHTATDFWIAESLP